MKSGGKRGFGGLGCVKNKQKTGGCGLPEGLGWSMTKTMDIV